MKVRPCHSFLTTAAAISLLVACDSQMPLDFGQNYSQKELDNTDSSPVETQLDSFGQLLNLQNIISQLRMVEDHGRGYYGQGIKIAILDNGFSDLSKALGNTLPQSVFYDENSYNPPAPTRHGTTMAELVYQLATGQDRTNPNHPGPQLQLYNSNGFSNFQESVQKAIAAQVDIILYAQIWEYGGNFNGQGFINRVVNEATGAGILWVNAAGNYRHRIWSGPVVSDGQRQIIFGHDGTELSFRVSQPQTVVKTTLVWNDFSDDIEYATSQDLDFELLDRNGTVLATGDKRQSGSGNKGTAEWSAHAREVITTQLDPGVYRIRARRNSDNFDDKSWLRFMVQGESVELLGQSSANSILIPADNPTVITVGAEDYSNSSASPIKPDLALASTVNLKSGRFIHGTSTAAAFATAKLAVSLSTHGPMGREQAIDLLQP